MQVFRKTHKGPAVRVHLALAAALFLSGLIPAPAGAQDTSIFNFLRLPAGARSAALGGAGTSFLDGSSSFYNNPAGLADPTSEATSTAPWGMAGEVSLTHHEALGNLRQDVVTLGFAKGPDAFAFSFNTLYSEKIDWTDNTGALQGSFGLTDIYVGGAFARNLGAGWRIGGSAAYVSEVLLGAKANTWSFGLGTRWDLQSLKGLSLGLAILNLGSDAQFKMTDGTPGEKFSLPSTVSGGATYAKKLGSDSRFLLTAEARKARDEDLLIHGGLEVGYSILALRGGGRVRKESTDLTAGLGLKAGRFHFDYAFVAFGSDVADTHRAELTVLFGL
jgi:hypothetical protein